MVNRQIFFRRAIMVLLLAIAGYNSILAIDPGKEYIRTPDSLGLTFESFFVKTSDGFDINTWVYLPDAEKDNGSVLILAYPDAGNMSYFVYQSAILSKQGYTVVTFDYRGFGKSSDFTVVRDNIYHVEFVHDLYSVVSTIDEKFPNKKIGIWAMSMGTIITTKAMERLNGNVDFIVAEGFVTDTLAIRERTLDQKGKSLKLPEDRTDYLRALKSLKVPIMIFAASKDEITTYEDAKQFKSTANGKCKIVYFEGEHLSGFNVGKGNWGQYYTHQIDLFVDEVLAK